MVESVSSKFVGLIIWANTLHPTVTFQSVYACLNSYWQVIAWALNSYFIPGVSCWLVLLFDAYLFPGSLKLSSLLCTPEFVNLWVLLVSSGLWPSAFHHAYTLSSWLAFFILSHDLLLTLILLSSTSILSWPFSALSLQFWSSYQCYVWHNITFWQTFTKKP